MGSFVNRAVLTEIVRLWQGQCGPDGTLPARTAFPPERLKPWLGNIVLVEPLDGGADFVIRLYGTKVAAMFGSDMTGRRYSQFLPEHHNVLMTPLRMAMQSRRAVFSRHRYALDTRSWQWERVAMPLAADGRTVDMLLVALYPTELQGGEAVRLLRERPEYWGFELPA